MRSTKERLNQLSSHFLLRDLGLVDDGAVDVCQLVHERCTSRCCLGNVVSIKVTHY